MKYVDIFIMYFRNMPRYTNCSGNRQLSNVDFRRLSRWNWVRNAYFSIGNLLMVWSYLIIFRTAVKWLRYCRKCVKAKTPINNNNLMLRRRIDFLSYPGWHLKKDILISSFLSFFPFAFPYGPFTFHKIVEPISSKLVQSNRTWWKFYVSLFI